jgi:hypothetical protein
MEHLGHEIHHAHQAAEVQEALHEMHEMHEFGAGGFEVAGILGRHAIDPALKGAQALLNMAGGEKAAAAIGDATETMKGHVDNLIHALQERYGKNVTRGLLGISQTITGASMHALGVGGLAAAIPGKHFVAAIPLFLLAEGAKRAGLLEKDPVTGKDPAIERAFAWFGTRLQAIIQGVKKGGLKMAYIAGRSLKQMTGNIQGDDNEPMLSPEEMNAIVRDLHADLMAKWKEILEPHQEALSILPEYDQPVPPDGSDLGNPKAHQAWQEPKSDGSPVEKPKPTKPKPTGNTWQEPAEPPAPPAAPTGNVTEVTVNADEVARYLRDLLKGNNNA